MGTVFSPRLSNPYIIDDVAHFVQPTKPLTRIGGSPLVVGDRWYKSDEQINLFWKGTNWVGDRVYGSSGTMNGPSSVTPCISLPRNTSLIFIEYINWFGLTGVTHNVNNHFRLRFCGHTTSGVLSYPATSLFIVDTSTVGSSSSFDIVLENIVFNPSLIGLNIRTLGLSHFTVGSPTTSGFNTNVSWCIRSIV